MRTEVEDTGEKDVKEPESYIDQDFMDFYRETVEKYEDVSTYVVPAKLAKEILTDKRIEIIRTVREQQIESKRELARKLDRDIKSVSRDLDILFKHGVINYEEKKGRKIPELSADKIIIEPL